MKQIKELRQIAKDITAQLGKSDEVLAIWFYGAAQRGRIWEESDVDLLIVTKNPPLASETRTQQKGVLIHLHWIGHKELEQKIKAEGDLLLHGRVGAGELLYDESGNLTSLSEQMCAFSPKHQLYQMMPHLNTLLEWARDLRKRMALHDERPRRAAARQWTVDQHAGAILLIEKGLYPHNEAAKQALDARIFVPNMADPNQIEEFVAPRVEKRLMPQLRVWAADGEFDEAALSQRYGFGKSAAILQFAARRGWLKAVQQSDRSGFPIEETVYRPA